MQSFGRAQPGDPFRFPAAMYNALVDLLQRQQSPIPSAGRHIPSRRCSGIVDVYNNSTSDVYVGQILGIGGPLYTPTENENDFQYDPSLTGVEPNVENDKGRFAVAIEPIRADAIGKCAVSGVTPARVYVSNADDEFCDVIEAETVDDETVYLGTGGSGARILWREDAGDGEGTIVWAIVRLGDNADGLRLARLTETLYSCDTAAAEWVDGDTEESGSGSGSGAAITIRDRCQLVDIWYRLDDALGGTLGLIDPGTIGLRCLVWVTPATDGTNNWDAVAFGRECDGESSVSSESESESSPSSESGSSLSSESGSESEPSGSESGSSKSTAVVRASWTKGGYTALFVEEAPEVRFDDVMEAVIRKTKTTIPIDPRFYEVCEPGSLRICGCVPDRPVLVGASVDGVNVTLRLPRARRKAVNVVVRLTGIRKGFAGMRFPERTRKQFEANERFYRRAGQ